MGESAAEPSDVSGAVAAADTVLFLTRSLEPRDREACIDLLAASGDDALFVSLAGLPEDRISSWRARTGDGAKFGVVIADDIRRSAAAVEGAPASERVRTVDDPSNLTRLGVELSNVLHDWADGDTDTALCFHSMTALLQYVDRKQAFRFLHVLSNHVRSVGATAHFHMDPAAHDETAIGTFASLVDATVERDDGGWSIRSR